MRGSRTLYALAMLAALGACSEPYWTSNVHDTMALGPSSAIATNADIRLVHRFRGAELSPVIIKEPVDPKDPNSAQRTIRRMESIQRDYLCAEPSPDVAKAVQAALSLSTSAAGTVTPPAGGTAVEAQLAFQTNAARSESMAQLTKRIATIQLLRDGLYRACEAYANGAIGPEIYTAIISRYDRMMITMLLGEMAAGNFGSAAILSGNSSTEASADASAGAGGRSAMAQVQYQRAKDDYEAQVRLVEELKVRRSQAQKRADAKKPPEQDNSSDLQEVAELEIKIAAEEKILAVREADLKTADAARTEAKKAEAQAQALASARGRSSASAGGTIVDSPAKSATDMAATLARMQRSYLNDPPMTTMIMMCFSELARPEPIGRELRERCKQIFDSMQSTTAQGLIWDTSARPQLREIDAASLAAVVAALKDKVSPEQLGALIKVLRSQTDTPSGATPASQKQPALRPAVPPQGAAAAGPADPYRD